MSKIKFNHVVGNPPYSTQIVNKNDHKEYYDKMGKGAKHSALTFLIKSIDHLEDGGSVIFIIPSNGLCLKNSETFRKYVLDNGSISDLYYTNKDLFGDAKVQGNLMIIRIIKNKVVEANVTVEYSNGKKYSSKYLYDSSKVFPIVISKNAIEATYKVMKNPNILDVMCKPNHNNMGTSEFPFLENYEPNANKVIVKLNRGNKYVYGWSMGHDTSNCWKVAFSTLCKIKEILQEGGIACGIIGPDECIAFSYSYIKCSSEEEANHVKNWFHHPLFVISMCQLYDNSYISDGNIGRLSIPPINEDAWEFYNIDETAKKDIIDLYDDLIKAEKDLMRK